MISDALTLEIEALVTCTEVRLALEEPISAEEREEVLSLVRWFTRRYSTAADRLMYVRQACARWRRGAAAATLHR